jgi:hypothetical protein
MAWLECYSRRNPFDARLPRERPALALCAPSLHAAHQRPSPSIRRRVADRAEHRQIGRRVKRTGTKLNGRLRADARRARYRTSRPASPSRGLRVAGLEPVMRAGGTEKGVAPEVSARHRDKLDTMAPRLRDYANRRTARINEAYDRSGGAGVGVGRYCSFAYSALACFRIGTSRSASFQSVRKS